VKRIYLGGLVASMLAASAMAAMPTGADAAPQIKLASSQDARALARAAATDLISSKAPALKISSYDKFVAKPIVSSEGTQYAAYDRTYRGIPVVGGDFVVVTDKSGNVITTSVAQTRKVDLASVTPKFGKDRAAQVAAGRLDTVDKVEGTRLIVLQKAGSHLAWETTVAGTAAGEASRQSVYVDAITGKVLGAKEHVADGSGNTGFNGSVTIGTTLSGSTYYLQDPNHSTVKCQDAANNTTFSGSDDAWGTGSETSKETGCVDALYAAEGEESMLSSWLGRNGFDGSGGGWPIRVGLNDVNAYYDGTQIQIGHNQDASPKWIASIDVLTHEAGHGIDDHTPGGISGSGTQEFVADVFGAASEAYINNATDRPDYTVGETVNLVGQGPIRYMYKPSLAGDPDCYSSSIPSTEVHAAAGPGNHWFYLLAEGTNPTNGQPTSPTCNSTTLTGVGIQNATKIMYNAMLMKTSSSSYLKYRTWTLTAAKNLDSTCGLFNKTKAAWNAVSVPAQTADPTCGSTGGVTVNNPGNKSGTVGTAISSFTVTASGGTTPYTWSATGLPAGITIGSSSGTVSGTPTTAGTYNVTVTAKDAANVTGSTSFTFTINGSGGTCTAAQKLGNPGFESGNTVWSSTSGVIGQYGSQEPTHSGTWDAWLDGYGSSHTDTLSQSVTIPSGCSATLSFYLHIDSSETTTSTAYDKLTVKIGSTTLATYSNLNKASGYSLKSFNVSSFAGQTVTVLFSGVEDSSLQTSFVVDDTALNVS